MAVSDMTLFQVLIFVFICAIGGGVFCGAVGIVAKFIERRRRGTENEKEDI